MESFSLFFRGSVVSLFPSSYDCFKKKEFLDDSEKLSDSGLQQVALSKTPSFFCLQKDSIDETRKKDTTQQLNNF